MAKRITDRKNQPAEKETPGTRLNKVIADAGMASRRAADAMIAEGRVRVNGRVTTELGTRVSPNDQIAVDGKLIGLAERHVYILMNKPKDTITTTSDERGRRTVIDLVDSSARLYPVGRLDRNTTGALLITNDGDLAHRLMHPSYGIERSYEAELDRPLSFADAREIARGGIDLGEGDITGECEVFVDDRDRRHVAIMLREGKNREVRRIFEAFEYDVAKLNRRAYAGLTTRGLARGDWRHLDRNEIADLRRLVQL